MLATAAAPAGSAELPSRPHPPIVGAPPAPSPSDPGATALSVGSSGPTVRALQRALRRAGEDVTVDGVFGLATARALRSQQRRLGLPATGVADVATLRRMRVPGITPAGTVQGGRGGYLSLFPVLGDHQYANDWGAPRAQGGHEGTDILAERHTPLVAVADSTVSKLSRVESGLGGIYVWLRRRDGTQYYYAHMQTLAAGLEVGTPVSAGQVIGTVGNSGDARYGVTHVHFEIRNEWTPMNPYPHLRAVDRDE